MGKEKIVNLLRLSEFKQKIISLIPTKISQLANDSNYIVAEDDPTVPAWAKQSSKPTYTKNEIGLSNVDNTADISKPVSTPQKQAIDTAYANSNAYTDTKIAELINGAPTTLDTLGEIAQAMQENDNVVDALDAAMGSKAPQAELDGHTGNSTIHITASERTKWNSKMEKTGDASNTTAAFTQASALANIGTGEKISVIMGKVSKAVAALITHVGAKATGNEIGHVRLSDNYSSAISNGAAANGVGASQKAVADAYVALNNSLGGLEFAQDAEGNWGYKPAGADTVTPFRNGAMMIGTFSGGYPSAAAATSKYTNLTTYANSIITIDGVLPSMVADDYIAVVTGYNADHYSNWAGSTSNGTGASLKIVITDNKTITVKNTGVCTINYAGDTQYRYHTRARVEGKVYYIGK